MHIKASVAQEMSPFAFVGAPSFATVFNGGGVEKIGGILADWAIL